MANTPDTSDDALIRMIERSDKAAMRVLYERHAPALTAFIRNRLSDPVEAADVVQDTFMEVWSSASKFQARSTVRSWMYSIARNKAVDRVRKLSRLIITEPDETIADGAPDAEMIIAQAEDAHRVRTCLNALKDAQRSAVTLAFFQDMTYREISIVEGVSEGTVKSRVHHAKKLLLHCLSK
ncbi:MAG: RNA polymerase sigma factor [Pseudomonadota bacterium]